MKFLTVILIIAFIVSSCLFNELEAKKSKHGEKIKVEKVKEKVAHKHVKHQPDQPKSKSIDSASEPKVLKDVKTVKHNGKDAIEEIVKKKHFKPRPPIKSLSEYEQCKLECKRKRDQVNAKEYVNQLTEELRLAKEYLAKQEMEAAMADETIPTKSEVPQVEQHLEDTPHVPKPIIEVTHHQTDKDEI